MTRKYANLTYIEFTRMIYGNSQATVHHRFIVRPFMLIQLMENKLHKKVTS